MILHPTLFMHTHIRTVDSQKHDSQEVSKILAQKKKRIDLMMKLYPLLIWGLMSNKTYLS